MGGKTLPAARQELPDRWRQLVARAMPNRSLNLYFPNTYVVRPIVARNSQ
jgi:hypothetical protein